MSPFFDQPPKLWTPPPPAIIRPAKSEKAMLLVPTVGWLGKTAPLVSLAWHAGDSSPADPNTYAGVIASGVARHIVIAVEGHNTQRRSITSITAAGVTATSRYQQTGNNDIIAFFTAAIPANTSGDLVIDWSGANMLEGAAVWDVIGDLVSEVPTSSQVSTAQPQTCTMNIADGGFGIGYSYNGGATGGSPVCTWTGLVEDFDEPMSSRDCHSGACLNGLHNNLSVAASWSGTINTARIGIFCTWA